MLLIRLSGKEGEKRGGRERKEEIENIGEKRKKEINRGRKTGAGGVEEAMMFIRRIVKF